MITLTEEELWLIVKQANDYGHNGQRIISFSYMPAINATQRYGSPIFGVDNGPSSPTEAWEDRRPHL
ncbi:MAG: hypothetical protein Q7R33_04855 [Nitrosarchaeum sp.]|nr:hypothetical protein [Nitrosarchaeum sp.]